MIPFSQAVHKESYTVKVPLFAPFVCLIHIVAGVSASVELANRPLLNNWKTEAARTCNDTHYGEPGLYILNETHHDG